MLHYFSDIFSKVKGLSTSFDESRYSALELREELESLLEDAMKAAVDEGIDPRHFDNARFAVTAWVDESMMNLPWSDAMQWTPQLLQRRIYDTTQAGEQFYKRLESMNDMPLQVLRVYYACLEFGYRGRYCNKEDNAFLEGLKATYYRKIVEGSGSVEGVVSSLGRQLSMLIGKSENSQKSTLLYSVAAATIVVNVSIYFVYQYLLLQQVQIGL